MSGVAKQLVAVHPLLGDDRDVPHRAHRLGSQELVGELQIDGHFAVQLTILQRPLIDSAGREPLNLVQTLLASQRGTRLCHELLAFGIASRTGGVAAGRHRDRHQIDNRSLHVITSLRSMTSSRSASCYLWAIVL